MTDFMEYIKGGDILIAPSLDYKHQYVLKCDLCEEFFGEFEHFFSHYLSHYDMESSEKDDNLSQSGTMDEQQLYDEEILDVDDGMEEAANDDVVTISEHMSANEGEETIDSSTEEFICDDENLIFNDDTISLEEHGINDSHMENVHESPELFDLASNTDNDQLENDESPDKLLVEEKTNIDDKSNIEFVKKFMKSKEDVTALITAYKNEPHLWDFSHPVQCRKQEKRISTWKKIVIDLYKTRNLHIRSNEVAACIIYLRQKYRERKRSSESVDKNCNEILPTWVFKQLNFLNAFVESKPIGLLDIHQDLAPKQTIQILNIFNRCPHLWDSSTVEYYCTNKRNEAIAKMRTIITEEMDLEVEESALKNFLDCIRKYYSFEKRHRMGFVKGMKEKVKYYDNLRFLDDHVGPFQCSQCRRTVLTPLGLKAHKSQHDGTIPFECPECNKEFKIVDTYVNHLKRHMGDLNHECEICGKRFIRAIEVREHMHCHTGAKPFCCEICGASFRQRTGFGMHMKRHGKKYISFCPYCSKGFYSKDAMNMHAKSHTDERDCVCPICGKAFKTRKTLKSHVAIHENGNHECTLCGKSFKNKINLWQHTRKHRLNARPKNTPKLVSPIDKN